MSEFSAHVARLAPTPAPRLLALVAKSVVDGEASVMIIAITNPDRAHRLHEEAARYISESYGNEPEFTFTSPADDGVDIWEVLDIEGSVVEVLMIQAGPVV